MREAYTTEAARRKHFWQVRAINSPHNIPLYLWCQQQTNNGTKTRTTLSKKGAALGRTRTRAALGRIRTHNTQT